MKAILYKAYGGPEVLQMQEVEKPLPKHTEMLIRIFATAVNSGDWRLRKADPWAVRLIYGLTKPRKFILGSVFSGEIEALGTSVTRFKVGDQVFGSTGVHMGTYAEYLCLAEDGILAIKPSNISHMQAGSIPFGGTVALYFLEKANIKKGQKVLIYGASGAVGTAAVQLAKHFGAEVTAICGRSNQEMVRSLGADHIIDYTNIDFTGSGEKYDVIFETVNKLSFANCIKSLNKKGTLVLGASGLGNMLRGAWHSLTTGHTVLSGVVRQKSADMLFLKDLIEKGHYQAIVDRTYPLEQMAEAHRYVDLGHKKGNVAITLN